MHRTVRFAQRFQQREVLHVARADLQNIGILRHQLDVAIAHHFGDDSEPRLLRAFASSFRPSSSMP